MRRLIALLFCFAVLPLSLLLSGCVPEMEEEEESDLPELVEASAPVQPETGGTAAEGRLPERMALPYTPGASLDPVTCPDGVQQVIGSLLCEGLFRLNTKLEPVTCLCESYACDDTARRWTIVLRAGVLFSDGTALTAGDVKTTLDRARNSARYGSRLRQIESVEAAGDTVFIQLSAGNRGLPALLDVPIVKLRDGVPFGTGPYRLSWELESLSLAANDYWWRGKVQPTDRIFLVDAKDNPRYRFTSGEVHLVLEDLTEGGGVTGNFRSRDVYTTDFQYIACNTSSGALNSEPFRKALSMGINRADICASVLSGHAVPAQFPVSPASALYPSDLEQPWSVDAFKTALQQSGYAGGQTLVLLVNAENDSKVSAANAVARTFTANGVRTEVRALPWAEYHEAALNGEFDLCWCEARLAPDWNLSPLLSTWGNLNIGGWGGTGAASLMEAYAAAQDRAAALKELCRYVQNHAPILPVCFKNLTVLSAADVIENLIPTEREPFYNLPDCAVHIRGQ